MRQTGWPRRAGHTRGVLHEPAPPADLGVVHRGVGLAAGGVETSVPIRRAPPRRWHRCTTGVSTAEDERRSRSHSRSARRSAWAVAGLMSPPGSRRTRRRRSGRRHRPGARSLRSRAGDLDEQFVADRMPVLIVDLFEVVEIDEEHTDLEGPGARRALHVRSSTSAERFGNPVSSSVRARRASMHVQLLHLCGGDVDGPLERVPLVVGLLYEVLTRGEQRPATLRATAPRRRRAEAGAAGGRGFGAGLPRPRPSCRLRIGGDGHRLVVEVARARLRSGRSRRRSRTPPSGSRSGGRPRWPRARPRCVHRAAGAARRTRSRRRARSPSASASAGRPVRPHPGRSRSGRSRFARISCARGPLGDVAGERHALGRLVDTEDRAGDRALRATGQAHASGNSRAVAGSPAARSPRYACTAASAGWPSSS